MSAYNDEIKLDALSLSPDARRAIIQKILADKHVSVSRWSRRAGIGNSLYNFLSGRTESLTQGTLEKLAGAINITVGDITGSPAVSAMSGRTVLVRGDLSAGTWRDAAEWPPVGQFKMDLPVPMRWQGIAYGLKISGRSMNKKWADGTIVLCVPFVDYGYSLKSGEDYVVVHRRNSLGLIEATVKRYEEHGNEVWLCAETDDKEEMDIIKVPREDRALRRSLARQDDKRLHPPVNHIYIVAVILGGYTPTYAGRFDNHSF